MDFPAKHVWLPEGTCNDWRVNIFFDNNISEYDINKILQHIGIHLLRDELGWTSLDQFSAGDINFSFALTGACLAGVGGLWEPHRPKGLVRKRLGCYRLWLHVVDHTFSNSQQRICWVSISGAGDWWHENARPEKPEQSWNLVGTFRCWVAKLG